ncbi:MAG: lactate utilization protein [Candidatus Eisenbacteria bacterium]|uniref:Lactate utilization protein n=1 Tax=Eiseniibacteriota bacterium TaxID=2212470 RepID=A0A948WAW5_UNCEI|nr:lactate utilization protein [Candidatus Eisenbacteria bacterium]MBU2689423.1 lactate utilization protein [Candidatus Eisenbacteria bacterium]
MLQNIREALKTDPGSAAPPAYDAIDKGRARLVAHDLERDDLIKLFCERAQSSGSTVHRVKDVYGLKRILAEIAPSGSIVSVAAGAELATRLGEDPSALWPESCRILSGRSLTRETLFEIEAALTGVEQGIAETGSIILSAGEDKRRSASLTAKKHVAVIFPDQIRSDMLDWTAGWRPSRSAASPSGMTVISGPSKTADIEMKLVVGVHGPAELHLILFDGG